MPNKSFVLYTVSWVAFVENINLALSIATG